MAWGDNFVKMSSSSCPICEVSAMSATTVGRTPMLKCSACGVVVSPPQLRATNEEDYYQQQYTLTRTVRSNKEMHRYFRYPEYATLIGDVLKEQPPPGRWLDVGCDNGFFLDDVRRYGYEVQGVEPSATARSYAAQIGLDVRSDLSEATGSFNIVSLWHVLEHMDLPYQGLVGIREHMTDHGLLCIRVPNAGGLWSRLLKDRWIWFQPHHHVVHYTRHSLELLLKRAGFRPLFIKAQQANTRLTRRAYTLSNDTFFRAQGRPLPSIRDRAARWYQDITGQELYALARRI